MERNTELIASQKVRVVYWFAFFVADDIGAYGYSNVILSQLINNTEAIAATKNYDIKVVLVFKNFLCRTDFIRAIGVHERGHLTFKEST